MDRVVSGEKVAIRADTWNRLVGLAESQEGAVGNSGAATPPRGRHLLVVNHGQTTLPRYSVVEITGADNTVATADEPVLTIEAPSGGTGAFAVLMEPAPKGKVVRAVISGVARANAVGAAGSFGGPSADGTITEGGAGAVRILVPGNPGVVLLNAGDEKSYRPFEAWINYQPSGGGWTLWLVPGPVYYWGKVVQRSYNPSPPETSALSLVDRDNTGWTPSNGLMRKSISTGSWYLAIEFTYDEGGSLRPISWKPSIVSGSALEATQQGTQLKYIPIASFTLSGSGASASVSITQLRTGLVMIRETTGGLAAPTEPSTCVTIGSTSEGSETASSDSWTASADGTGLNLYVITRVVYDETSDHVLYGYYRALQFTDCGLLYSVSEESRYVIDTPVEILTQ